ncbi:hypothetical protein M0805_008567 [Coniferiporia weirii]|nr:hypothetical protein M0805_008567 [Coniferiporia weirii]
MRTILFRPLVRRRDDSGPARRACFINGLRKHGAKEDSNVSQTSDWTGGCRNMGLTLTRPFPHCTLHKIGTRSQLALHHHRRLEQLASNSTALNFTSMSQPGNHSGTVQEILYLKGDLRFRFVWERIMKYNAVFIAIEIGFKANKPRHPIFAKVKSGKDQRKSPLFKKVELVNWGLGNYLRLLLPVDLSISVEEVHKIKRNKDIATFELNLTSADIIEKDTFSADDTSGRARVKLTFVSPTDELAERLVQEAQTAIGNKKVLLESLGKAGKVIAVLMKFTDLASDVHPAAKAAFLLVGVLYEQFQAQQECHDEASALIKGVASLLPFVGDDVQALARNAGTLQTIKEMLDLFCMISELVVDYSGKGMLGDLFSSRKGELDSSKEELRRLRGTYDWCIKTEIWRSVIETDMRTEDIQLQQLRAAGRAYYDVEKRCLGGTRTSVLERIREWGTSESGPGLFWLHGMAGSGKSAIANSVAYMFEEQQCLLGCFFCKRDDPECRVPMNVIPTLAMHFSKWHQTYRSMVASVIQGRDGPKLMQNLQWQFELLMKNPLTSLATEHRDLPPKPLIIVVDALDECGDSAELRSGLAESLASVANVVPWIKMFITSRPLPEFYQVFHQTAVSSETFNISTEVALEQVEDDIVQYTRHCAERFQVDLLENQITELAAKASGLFIWTSTVFKFIGAQINKCRAVQTILSQDLVGNAEAELDKVYITVLQSAAMGPDNTQIIKSVIGLVVCISKNIPLPENVLLEFLFAIENDMSLLVLKETLDRLQAVLYRDASNGGAIRVCHPSFLDFVNTQARSQDYWTQPTYMDEIMAASCIYWMNHFAGCNVIDMDTMHGLNQILCTPKALYWLECLSLINELKSGINILELFSKHYKPTGILAAASKDLHRILTSFYTPISVSTPHLYVSALSWVPTESYVAKTFYPHFQNQPLIGAGKEKSWNPTVWTANAGSAVSCVAYSPNGRHIVSGSEDNTLRIWDAWTGSPVGKALTGHSKSVWSVAYSPDGRHIVSGSSDNTLRIWDAQTGSTLGEPLTGHSNWVCSAAYSPDGRYIVSGSWDNTLRIWDAQTGSSVGEPIKAHSGIVWSVAYSPDGRHIVSDSDDNTLRIWNAQTGSPVGGTLTGHSGSVDCVAYSPDGRHVVSGSEDCTLRIWDAQTGGAVGEALTGHSRSVWSIAYSPDGRYIVSGSCDNTLRIWDAQTGSAVGEPLTGHSGIVRSVAYSPDGRHIVSGSSDKTLRIWGAQTGTVGDPLTGYPERVQSESGSDVDTMRIWDAQTGRESIIGHSEGVYFVAYSPDGRHIVSDSYDNTLRIWDAQTGSPVRELLMGHSYWVSSIAYSHDGRHIVCGSDDGTLMIWDVQTGNPMGELLTGHSGSVNSVAYSPDGRHIVSGSEDCTLRVWDAWAGSPMGKAFTGHSKSVWSVAYSPDGRHIVSGSEDCTLRVWDVQTGNAVGEAFTGHSSSVWSVAYSPGGKCIVSGASDNTLRVWGAQTGHSMGKPLIGHSGGILSVSYSPDGRHTMSGSFDNTVRIWNAQTGHPMGKPLTGHSGGVDSVSYSPDGQHIVSGSSDNTIRIWSADAIQAGFEVAGSHSLNRINNDGWVRDLLHFSLHSPPTPNPIGL